MSEQKPVQQLRKRLVQSSDFQPDSPPPPQKRNISFILTFIPLFFTWILLSGMFDLFHLGLGIISCGLVSFISSDLIFGSVDLGKFMQQAPRFVAYIPWLLYQVFKANIHVLILVFHPKMPDLIDPGIIRFRSRLKGDMALTTFANSITLTPGTITVYVTEYGDFEVHAIDEASGQSLPGEMETRIARVFNVS